MGANHINQEIHQGSLLIINGWRGDCQSSRLLVLDDSFIISGWERTADPKEKKPEKTEIRFLPDPGHPPPRKKKSWYTLSAPDVHLDDDGGGGLNSVHEIKTLLSCTSTLQESNLSVDRWMRICLQIIDQYRSPGMNVDAVVVTLLSVRAIVHDYRTSCKVLRIYYDWRDWQVYSYSRSPR